MTKEMQDQPLFGPVDQVVNTLEMEAGWVKGELKRCEKGIDRLETEIELLQKREAMIAESLKTVREAEKKRQEIEGGPLSPAGKGKDGSLKAEVGRELKKTEKTAAAKKGKKS